MEHLVQLIQSLPAATHAAKRAREAILDALRAYALVVADDETQS